MLIEPTGIKTLDGEHRRQLGTRQLRRQSSRPNAARTALAGALVAWAARLAPEMAEPRLLRTRTAPN